MRLRNTDFAMREHRLIALPRLLRDELFAASCIHCGRRGGAFCVECAPARSEMEASLLTGAAEAPFVVVSLGRYEGALRSAIIAYKSGRRDVGDAFGDLLALRCVGAVPPGTAVVGIPTTAKRRRERGFDNGVFLARRLAQAASVPCREVLEQTSGDTQRGRNRTERLNATGRFRVRSGLVTEKIVLVDDVLTTGATLRDAAAVLGASGMHVIGAIAVART